MRPNQFHGCEFLLESYCRTASLERQFAAEFEALPPGPRKDKMAKARRAEAALAMQLATKLRLSPRSKTDRNVQLKIAPKGPRPWEIAADDDPPKAG